MSRISKYVTRHVFKIFRHNINLINCFCNIPYTYLPRRLKCQYEMRVEKKRNSELIRLREGSERISP